MPILMVSFLIDTLPMLNKKTFFVALFFISNLVCFSQIAENFSDGDFVSNPVWIGNISYFAINSAAQLQTNLPVVPTSSTSYYLSTVNNLATATQWEFLINLKFSTSGSNYVDVFLTASASDLTAVSTNGYFVRIGNTNDEISLYKKEGSTVTMIIDGVNGIVNSSNNLFKIKVIRDESNKFILYRDNTGLGTSYISEGSITDNTFLTSNYFGFLIKQSTAVSAFNNHFFDDINVQPYLPDIVPPTILSSTIISNNAIDILFSEALDALPAGIASNYIVNNNIGSPISALLDATNNALVHLSFNNNFPNALTCQLTVNGIADLMGNITNNTASSFTYFAPYQPKQYDIVIDEIMCDPSPQIGLPNYEWIELKNTSTSAINLLNWKIGDAVSTSGAMPNFLLMPDSFVIVCTSSAVNAMLNYGNAIAVTSFPSLDNTQDLLFLKSPQGQIIHAVNYKDSWYKNELKKGGGWTLEMIDTKNPCNGFSNWRASENLMGGSPAKKNSIDGFDTDIDKPTLTRAYTTNSTTIVLLFSEPLDSLQAASINNYSVSDGIGIPISATPLSPLFDKVILTLSTPIDTNKVYTISVNKITDCVGNIIGNENAAKVGISRVADSLDIVINEVLFNPPAGGTDYVEIYNRSKKIIDLNQTYIANRNSAGVVSSIVPISSEKYLLFPQDFMLISENTAMVKATYITQNPAAFIEINTLPSLNNDKGDIIVLNAQGKITDELAYSEKWHFKLIDNNQGVALERINYDVSTQLQDNWHSAATSAGYGTPGFKNSQYNNNMGVQGEVKISPAIVSPDNDGIDDFATINYSFPTPGYVANITIFDAAGRPIRYLQKTALCGTNGFFTWDGLGDKNQILPMGIYIIYTDVFNSKGQKKQFKIPIVLAREN